MGYANAIANSKQNLTKRFARSRTKMKLPQISVCIPTYNQAEFLESCIKSLLCQETKPSEIIVSNNKSTDRTAEILHSFRGRVTVVEPTVHLDMVTNFQFCAAAAAGEWIVFMTSDDLAEPHYVSSLVCGIKRFPGAVAVRAGHRLIDGQGNVLARRSLLGVPEFSSGEQAFVENINGPCPYFEATAVKRQVLWDVGGFNPGVKLFGDWALWLALSEAGGFGTVKRLITRYRVWSRADRGKSRIPRELADEIVIYNEIILPQAIRRRAALVTLATSARRSRGIASLERVLAEYSREEIAAMRPSLLAYGKAMGAHDAAEAVVAGNYRHPKVPRWKTKVRSSARGLAESLLGWF
jgi:hypothetical protein